MSHPEQTIRVGGEYATIGNLWISHVAAIVEGMVVYVYTPSIKRGVECAKCSIDEFRNTHTLVDVSALGQCAQALREVADEDEKGLCWCSQSTGACHNAYCGFARRSLESVARTEVRG